MATQNEDENQHTDEGALIAVEGDPNVWMEGPPGGLQHYRNLGAHWDNAEVAVHPNYNLIEGGRKEMSSYAPDDVEADRD